MKRVPCECWAHPLPSSVRAAVPGHQGKSSRGQGGPAHHSRHFLSPAQLISPSSWTASLMSGSHKTFRDNPSPKEITACAANSLPETGQHFQRHFVSLGCKELQSSPRTPVAEPVTQVRFYKSQVRALMTGLFFLMLVFIVVLVIR